MSKIETHLIRRIQNHLGSAYFITNDENGLLLELLHVYKNGKHWWNPRQYVATIVVEGAYAGTTDAMLAQELAKFSFNVVVK